MAQVARIAHPRILLNIYHEVVITQQFHKLDPIFSVTSLSAVKQNSDYWVTCMAKFIRIREHNNSSLILKQQSCGVGDNGREEERPVTLPVHV